MNTSPSVVTMLNAIESVRSKVQKEPSKIRLAEKLDIDQQRVTYFARVQRSLVGPEVLSKLFAHYGYAVVKLDSAGTAE